MGLRPEQMATVMGVAQKGDELKGKTFSDLFDAVQKTAYAKYLDTKPGADDTFQNKLFLEAYKRQPTVYEQKQMQNLDSLIQSRDVGNTYTRWQTKKLRDMLPLEMNEKQSNIIASDMNSLLKGEQLTTERFNRVVKEIKLPLEIQQLEGRILQDEMRTLLFGEQASKERVLQKYYGVRADEIMPKLQDSLNRTKLNELKFAAELDEKSANALAQVMDKTGDKQLSGYAQYVNMHAPDASQHFVYWNDQKTFEEWEQIKLPIVNGRQFTMGDVRDSRIAKTLGLDEALKRLFHTSLQRKEQESINKWTPGYLHPTQ
uniref:Uncharacterized protein n=1 Tax=viral metagenome TaxID=1070528 RepID=A0A6M3J9X3_9ZZZZ